jgi:uncharacterized membrane protein
MQQLKSLQRGEIRDNSSRWVSIGKWSAIASGGALAIFGLTRRSKAGAALAAAGGALALLGSRVSTVPGQLTAHSSVLLNCPREQAYQFWRDFENLPRFMRHLHSVNKTGGQRYQWTALGPLGARISWEAEIVTERENELISWRSLPGSEVEVDGSVEFRSAPADRGTIVEAVVIYRPPAGSLGKTVAGVFGKYPSFIMRQDLRRFKSLVEAGEVPTIEGQTHGPRSRKIAALRFLNPDQPIRPESREAFSAVRRTA